MRERLAGHLWRDRVELAMIAMTLAILLATSRAEAMRVELVIDEPAGGRPARERTVPWPITTGVPFPRGMLTDSDHCRLIDEQGREWPLQSRVAATWDAQRSSIRWLTIDWVAQPGRHYTLEFGPDIRRKRL